MKHATDAEGGSIERKKGTYKKIAPKSKAKIAKYTAENRIAASVCHFEKNQAFLNLKESMVRGWKKAYCASLRRKETINMKTAHSTLHFEQFLSDSPGRNGIELYLRGYR